MPSSDEIKSLFHFIKEDIGSDIEDISEEDLMKLIKAHK